MVCELLAVGSYVVLCQSKSLLSDSWLVRINGWWWFWASPSVRQSSMPKKGTNKSKKKWENTIFLWEKLYWYSIAKSCYGIKKKLPDILFPGAPKHLYNWLCPSVCWLLGNVFVRRSTRRAILANLALLLVTETRRKKNIKTKHQNTKTKHNGIDSYVC